MDERFDVFKDIDPSLWSYRVLHEYDIDIITDYYQTQAFSYPVVVSHVGYLVSMISNPEDKSLHLGTLHVYNKPAIIRLLLEFLKDVQVKNMKDLHVVQHFLSSLLSK